MDPLQHPAPRRNRKRRALPAREEKYLDRGFSTNPTPTGVTVANLALIEQGTEQGQRVGSQVELRRLTCRGTIQPWAVNSPAVTFQGQRVRYILCIDHQSNRELLAPNASDLLALPATIDAHYKTEELQRFTVLYDQTWTLNPSAITAEGPGASVTSGLVTYSYDFLLSVPLHYVDPGLGQDDRLTCNNLAVFLLCDDDNANLPLVTGNVRLTYTD